MGCGEWPVGSSRMWLPEVSVRVLVHAMSPAAGSELGTLARVLGRPRSISPRRPPRCPLTQVSLGPVPALSWRDGGSAGRVLRPWPCGTVSLRNKQCVRYSDPLSLPVIAHVPQSIHCFSVFVTICLPLCVPGVHDTLASLRPSCWSPCFEGPQPRANRGGEVGPKPAPCQGGRVAGH